MLLCAVITFYVVARELAGIFIARLNPEFGTERDLMLHGAVMLTVAVYVALMALPFMPSAEIGISMLVMFGARMALLVYASTVLALTLSYLAGRLIPASILARIFRLLGLRKATALASRLESLPASRSMSLLANEAPIRAIPFLIRHRFLALAVLLNMPGNTVIGGGGGIALIAGMSRLFPFPLYLLTVALAVAPVPLIVFLAAQT